MVNGDGLRTVIWLSGCSHKCPGCFNPETHCPLSGIKFDKSAKDELFKNLKEDWCDGITFSGGDPLFETNTEEVIEDAETEQEVLVDENATESEAAKEPIQEDKTEVVDEVDNGTERCAVMLGVAESEEE